MLRGIGVQEPRGCGLRLIAGPGCAPRAQAEWAYTCRVTDTTPSLGCDGGIAHDHVA